MAACRTHTFVVVDALPASAVRDSNRRYRATASAATAYGRRFFYRFEKNLDLALGRDLHHDERGREEAARGHLVRQVAACQGAALGEATMSRPSGYPEQKFWF